MASAVLDDLESLLDGFITVKVYLEQFDGVGCTRAFSSELLERFVTLLLGSASEKYVVRVRRLEECLDSFVSNAIVGTGNENNFSSHYIVDFGTMEEEWSCKF